MKTYFTFMKESHTLYHKSYTDAINAAMQKHSDLNVSDEDRDTHIAMGPRKPAEGETVKHNIPATDKSGDKHMIHIQVYNKGGNKPFELNTYSSKISKKKVAEETEMRHSSDSLGDHMALKAYANKLGPKHIDRHDLLTAASHMAFGNKDHLDKHLKALDTDVRDKVKEYMKEETDHKEERSKLINKAAGHNIPSKMREKIRKAADLHGMAAKDPEKYAAAALAASKALNEEEADQIDEAIKLNSKVRIHDPGKKHHGEEGTVVEFRRGLPGVRPSYYTVDHGGTSTQFTRENIKTLNEEEADQIDEANSHREVDNLKSKGKHHEAGQHAAKSGHDRQYGAHFGMRSDKEEAQRQFFKGYDSVKKTNEEADIDEALGTIKNMKAASKFGPSNISAMKFGEKARKAGMAKVSTTKDIGYKVVDVGPGQKETVRKMHNFKEEEADQIHEEHMSEKDAERLAQKHVNAAISAKKAGDLKGHDAHAEASNYIRDKILKHTDSAKGIPSGKIRSTAKKLFDELSEHRIKEANQIDELKHSGGVLNNYLSKTNPDRNTPKENEKRAAGRGLALGKKWGKALGVNEPKVPATNEEVELDELDHGGIISRYIRKAGPGGSESFPKRKKGVDLALLKKWGDKGYGLPEPKVKAVQREEIEPLAEISAALARRASRAAMDE